MSDNGKWKFVIESGALFEAYDIKVFQRADFNRKDVIEYYKEDPSHLYMICTRPRVTFKPNSILIDAESITFQMEVHLISKRDPVYCVLKNMHNMKEFKLSKGRSYLEFYTSEGILIQGIRAADFYINLLSTKKEYDPDMDLKIQYIGQAFGKDGKRTSIDRLMDHKTLQAVQGDLIQEFYNEDIWFVLLNFDYESLSFIESNTDTVYGIDESINNFNKVVNFDVADNQLITVTEAALISYFKPNYNKEYKTTFPSRSHISYKFCYELDLNAFTVILDTSSIMSRVFTDEVKPSYNHFYSISLDNIDCRKHLFAPLFDLDGM